MKKALGTFAVLVFTASLASAQATRTWVSGVGDDANPCSRTAPCKTFAGAISKTAAGGEINVLDPGGFGGVTARGVQAGVRSGKGGGGCRETVGRFRLCKSGSPPVRAR